MSTHRSTFSKGCSAPLACFLLVAAFGLLFVGCAPRVRGPGDKGVEDISFTADDVSSLASSSASFTGSAVPGSSGSSAVLPSIDTSKVPLYDAIRAPKAALPENTFQVVNTFVNVRSEPSTHAAFIAKLNKGDTVHVQRILSAAWAQVDLPGGKTGYVSMQYLAKIVADEELASQKKLYEGQYYVDFAFLNVRKDASQNSEKIGQLDGQAIVKPEAMMGAWAKVTVDGKTGYVSTQYLKPFLPDFVSQVDTFHLPILTFQADQPDVIAHLPALLDRLKASGLHPMTLASFYDVLLAQQRGGASVPPKSIVLALRGLSSQNIAPVTALFQQKGLTATLFLQTDQVGLSGITETVLLGLNTAGFDVQSATRTGRDLRGLSDSDLKMELEQSRALLESLTGKPVFAVLYPQGGVSDRVTASAHDAGYLMGLASGSDTSFTRTRLLMTPTVSVTGSMTADDVLALVKR